MKKLMALAVVSVTMFAAASPAFADTNVSLQFLDASQLQSAGQIQTGDANAAADDGGYAGADQSLSIYQGQYNAGF